MKKILKIIKIIKYLLQKLPYNNFGDKLYSFIIFVYAHRRIPRTDSKLFSDYLYFKKIHNSSLDMDNQITSDKILVKDYVKKLCGNNYTVETIEIFNSIEDIRVDKLTKPCVIKPSHGNGSIVFLSEDRTQLSESEEELLKKALDTSLYEQSREKNYRYLRKRLICEPMIATVNELKDYKVFCFRGIPKIIQVDSDRFKEHKRNLYTVNWDSLDITYSYPMGEYEEKPKQLQIMIDISKKISVNFEFVRVDFYIHNNKVYVGELTHIPEAANGKFLNKEEEKLFSEILFETNI